MITRLLTVLIMMITPHLFALGMSDSSIEERLQHRERRLRPREYQLQFYSTVFVVQNLNHSKEANCFISPHVLQKMHVTDQTYHGNYLLERQESLCDRPGNFFDKDYTEEMIESLERFAFFKNSSLFHHISDSDKGYSYDAYNILDSFFDHVAAISYEHKNTIKAMMSVAAIVGCEGDDNEENNRPDENAYIGPFWLCCADVYAAVTTNPTGRASGFMNNFPQALLECLLRKTSDQISGYPRGTYQDENNPNVIFNYEVDIQWKHALPSKVTFRVDLSPMKEHLYRTQGK